MHKLILLALLLVFSSQTHAQTVEDGMGRVEVDGSSAADAPPPRTLPSRQGQPVVGRKAAQKYMAPQKRQEAQKDDSEMGPESHYLAVHVGSFISDQAYRWANDNSESNVGRLNVGVTYRLGEWVHSADFLARIDYEGFVVQGNNIRKISFLPVILFPDASSKFPLYFGVGAGMGVFLKQATSESAISFDYQLLLGARFFDVFQNTGFFVETGMKNHIHLLSDGQFNGVFVSLGAIFTF